MKSTLTNGYLFPTYHLGGSCTGHCPLTNGYDRVKYIEEIVHR